LTLYLGTRPTILFHFASTIPPLSHPPLIHVLPPSLLSPVNCLQCAYLCIKRPRSFPHAQDTGAMKRLSNPPPPKRQSGAQSNTQSPKRGAQSNASPKRQSSAQSNAQPKIQPKAQPLKPLVDVKKNGRQVPDLYPAPIVPGATVTASDENAHLSASQEQAPLPGTYSSNSANLLLPP
jgi:hypothetical protein